MRFTQLKLFTLLCEKAKVQPFDITLPSISSRKISFSLLDSDREAIHELCLACDMDQIPLRIITHPRSHAKEYKHHLRLILELPE